MSSDVCLIKKYICSSKFNKLKCTLQNIIQYLGFYLYTGWNKTN